MVPNLLATTLRGKLLFPLTEPLPVEILRDVLGGDLSRPIYAVFIPNLFTFLTGDFPMFDLLDIDLAVENPLLLPVICGTEVFFILKVELKFAL